MHFGIRWKSTGIPVLFLFLNGATSLPFAQEVYSGQILFSAGDPGYACFRIPAIVSRDGKGLVAFCEGRRGECSDFGDVDIVMRRSEDAGETWSPLERVVDWGELQAGNAAPVWDESDPMYPNGKLLLFYNTGTASEWEVRSGKGRRQAWFVSSVDGGRSWTSPQNITHFVHFDAWSADPERDERTLAFTPGHAIQLKKEPFAGRLYVAANHSIGEPQEAFEDYRSFGIFSDDHGRTWSRSADVPVPASNEAMATETSNGSLELNIRMQDGRIRRRLIASSSDGGATWDTTYIEEVLVSPVCQASTLNTGEAGMVFSGPNDEEERINLSLWRNKGDGWGDPELIHAGFAAYSDLVPLEAGSIGVLFEAENYSQIRFLRVPSD
jgi:sialidase-1